MPSPTAQPAPLPQSSREVPSLTRRLAAETHLAHLHALHQLLAVEDQAFAEERAYLADLTAGLSDLDDRLSQEPEGEIRAVLHAKRAETETELQVMRLRMAQREVQWPQQKAQMEANIAKLQARLGHLAVTASRDESPMRDT